MADNRLSQLAGYGRDFAQGASNAVASNVSGPVDALAWLMRKAGLPIQNPLLGSDWMAQRGLTAEPQNRLAGLLGEAAGMAGPMVAAAKAPQIARGLLKAGENAMTPRALNSQAGGLLMGKDPDGMTAAARDAAMRAVKYDRGWFRGGPEITDGKKTGDWYTRFSDEAADYAKRTPGAEVREYAAPINTIKSSMSYSPRLAQDIASRVESMGPSGRALAKQLREYYVTDKISGLEVWGGLSKHLGDDTAINVLKDLGFKGVEGVKKPQYLQVFPSTMVRDANRAAFHPERLNQNNIYGKATPGLLTATAGGAAALAAFRNSQANE